MFRWILVWIVASLFFGLLHVWILIPFAWIGDRLPEILHKVAIDSAFLFFSVALVSAIFFDYIIMQLREPNDSKKFADLKILRYFSLKLVNIFTIILALIILITTIAIYTPMYFSNHELTDSSIERLLIINLIIIFITIIYVTFLKYVQLKIK